MKSAIVLCSDDEARRELVLAAGEAGYAAHPCARMQEAVEIIRECAPSVFILADRPGEDALLRLRELCAAAPLIPTVAAMAKRDSARAVELMRAGASEAVAPPWTRKNLSACLAKALRGSGTAVSILPRPRSMAPLYFFAVGIFFAAALAALSARHAARLKAEAAARVDYWDLPYRHPSGAAFDGKNFWITDWFDGSLYEQSPAGMRTIRVLHFPDQTPEAMLFAANSVWTLASSGIITRRMDDPALTPVQEYQGDEAGTISMAYDGLYFWTLDARGRLHKRLLDMDLTEVASYPCPDASASAVVYDGHTLWTLDPRNRQLVRHNLERPDQALGAVPLPEYADGAYRPVALAWDGRNFWTVGEKAPEGSGPARIFRHPEIRSRDF